MTIPTLASVTIIVLLMLLILATYIDLDSHRIPNTLTASGIVLGFALQFAMHGSSGLLDATGGLVIGILALLPFYISGAMGAGDVKLMALVGVFLGPMTTLLAAGTTLAVGGVMAVAVLLYRSGGKEVFTRYRDMFFTSIVLRKLQYFRPSANSAAASRFPYAAAIAVGTISTLLYTSRLDTVLAIFFP